MSTFGSLRNASVLVDLIASSFVLTEDYSYPDDYPEAEEKITVTGVFDTYMEGDYQYCTLKDASLEQTDFSVKMRRFFTK